MESASKVIAHSSTEKLIKRSRGRAAPPQLTKKGEMPTPSRLAYVSQLIGPLSQTNTPANNTKEYPYVRVGNGPQTSALCGAVVSIARCTANKDHKKVKFRCKCNKPTCPECHRAWAARAASRTEDRLLGVKKALVKAGVPVGNYRQIVISPDQDVWTLERLEQDGGAAYEQAVTNFLNLYYKGHGGMKLTHGERKKHADDLSECHTKFCKRKHIWVPGVHTHTICDGTFADSEVIYRESGWILKVVPDKDDRGRSVFETARYLFTHAATFQSRQKVVRYFGLLSKGHCESVTKIKEPLRCKQCGAQMARAVQYPDGTIDFDGYTTPIYIKKKVGKWVLTAKQTASAGCGHNTILDGGGGPP